MNPKQGLFIINAYQTPNFYADCLDYFLQPIETKVLWKILREIIGFYNNLSDRRNVVSLTTIVDGKVKQQDDQPEERLSYGCGLSRKTVQKALKELCTYQVIKRIRLTSNGYVYEVNLDTDTIDWDGLEQRRNDEIAKQKAKISKARAKAQENADHERQNIETSVAE